MKKKKYRVETTFTYSGKWFVYVENEEAARELFRTKEIRGGFEWLKCWKFHSRADTTLPHHMLELENGENLTIEWDFAVPTGCKDIIVAVAPSKKILPVMKNKSSRGKKKCYEVVMAYVRFGKFYVEARSVDEAREIVERYCRQKNPIYRSSLPPEEVAWELLRKNIKKTIGKITLVET